MSWPKFAARSRTRSRSRASSAIPVFVWLYLEAGDGPAWGAGDVLRSSCVDRPARRLPRAALARRVAVRDRRRPPRRPAHDRDGGDPHARDRADPDPRGARSSSGGTSFSSSATDSCRRADTSSRSPSSGRRRPGSCTPRSASCSSPRKGRPGRSCCSGSASRSRSGPACSMRLRAWRQVQRGRDSRPEREP